MFCLDLNAVITILVCILFLWGFGKIFRLPFGKIFRFILNSILGGVFIFLINVIGSNFGFHIGLNIGTSMIVGLLGLPRSYFAHHFKLVFRLKYGEQKWLYYELQQLRGENGKY